jgi:8-oxo-dGTP pyrophosphatase MutT (NUDIX family)
MKDTYKTLPYRDNVACIVFKGDEFLLVQLHLWEPNWWKFPQGGINEEKR